MHQKDLYPLLQDPRYFVRDIQTGHSFRRWSIAAPRWCQVCRTLIWTFATNCACQCLSCGKITHRDCVKTAGHCDAAIIVEPGSDLSSIDAGIPILFRERRLSSGRKISAQLPQAQRTGENDIFVSLSTAKEDSFASTPDGNQTQQDRTNCVEGEENSREKQLSPVSITSRILSVATKGASIARSSLRRRLPQTLDDEYPPEYHTDLWGEVMFKDYEKTIRSVRKVRLGTLKQEVHEDSNAMQANNIQQEASQSSFAGQLPWKIEPSSESTSTSKIGASDLKISELVLYIARTEDHPIALYNKALLTIFQWRYVRRQSEKREQAEASTGGSSELDTCQQTAKDARVYLRNIEPAFGMAILEADDSARNQLHLAVERLVFTEVYGLVFGEYKTKYAATDNEFEEKAKTLRSAYDRDQSERFHEVTQILEKLSEEFSPSAKLLILTEAFTTLCKRVQTQDTGSDASADVIIPSFYEAVLYASKLRYPNAQAVFIADFTDGGGFGVEGYALTTFQAAVFIINNIEHPPSTSNHTTDDVVHGDERFKEENSIDENSTTKANKEADPLLFTSEVASPLFIRRGLQEDSSDDDSDVFVDAYSSPPSTPHFYRQLPREVIYKALQNVQEDITAQKKNSQLLKD